MTFKMASRVFSRLVRPSAFLPCVLGRMTECFPFGTIALLSKTGAEVNAIHKLVAKNAVRTECGLVLRRLKDDVLRKEKLRDSLS